MMESKMDAVEFPFPRRPWGQRVTRNATSSIVQTVFNRELGFPGFSKKTDNFGNHQTIRPTIRQLIYQRLLSLSEEPVLPIIIKLEDQGVGNGTINRKHIPNTWIKIVTRRSERILMVGDYLRQSMPQSSLFDGDSRNLEYTNSFYKLQKDISLGFKRFSCADSRGFVLMGEFMNFRFLENNTSGLHYATFTAKGTIRFYDLSRHNKLKTPRILTLPLEENLRCTDMYVDYHHSNLFVLALLNGTVRQIFKIKIAYPSLEVNSKTVTVNHSKLGPSVQMVIEQSVVLVTTNSEAYLGNIEDYFLPGQPDNLEIPILQNLGRFINTSGHYFSMIDTVWPPVSITVSNPEKFKSRYHFTSMHDGREIWTKTFAAYDECIFLPVMTEYSLMLHKFNDTYSIINVKKDSSDPPNYLAIEDTENNLLKTGLESNPTSSRFSSRPMTKCAQEKIENDQRKPAKRHRLIAMDYCDALDLIGVCILEAGVMVVSLYEVRTHKLFKRLPSLKIQEFRSRRRDNSEEDEMSYNEMTIDFELDSDLIFITIEYPVNKEYYCLNLLGENTPFTL